jgi:hypothetical protein
MSVLLMGAVMDRGPDKGALRSTLLAIANLADDFGFACPSVEAIATANCCDERTVLRRLGELEADGWLKIDRKIIGGRGNVYFVSLERLAVEVNEKSRRSPLWADMQRLIRAMDSGDKLSRMNGVLKFEKTPDSAGKIVSGTLFGDEYSGDKLSPEFPVEAGLNRAEVAQNDQIQENPVENEPFGGSEGENPGDKMSPVTGHLDHLTGDISNIPFNVFKRYLHVTDPKNPPYPPAGRVNEIDPVDQERWDNLKSTLKTQLCSTPQNVARRQGFTEIIPGQNDYDSCFLEWWLLEVRRGDGGAVQFVTEASDEAMTRAGIAKYSARLAMNARHYFYFGLARDTAVSFEVRGQAEPGLEIAAGAEAEAAPAAAETDTPFDSAAPRSGQALHIADEVQSQGNGESESTSAADTGSHGANGETLVDMLLGAMPDPWTRVKRELEESLRLADPRRLDLFRKAIEPAQLASVETVEGKPVWRLRSPMPQHTRAVIGVLGRHFNMAVHKVAGDVQIVVADAEALRSGQAAPGGAERGPREGSDEGVA